MIARAEAPRERKGTVNPPFEPFHLPLRAAAIDSFVNFRMIFLVYSNGLRRVAVSIGRQAPGTPRSAQNNGAAAIGISSPRNLQTPRKPLLSWKYASGIENPLVPGANASGGTAWPVTEYMEFIRGSEMDTVRVLSVELTEEK